ncbi:alpha/beta fold hydrolase [Oceanobacillus halophilus]|uniref:Alpha/beta hydrolase n=1 Tax=Oceanobacillus halophilus TaxID=930130 RepID=A0A494ZXB8_9BACI|nr:alpha/beta hydrolase [Oceanobacillus halophilus]RKQ31348.1 alpha/beta hydrolase [Oceanobacillus halophilus]
MERRVSTCTLNIDDVKVYCEYILNGKPPIVLIHGFVSSTYTFNRIIPLLENHFSIIALDLPGFGRSEKSTKFVYSYENYAKLVAKCMNYFQLDDASIIGHSMGGQIALYTARLVPDKIKKLVLLGCSGYLKSANRLLIYTSYLPLFNTFVKRSVNNKSVKDSLRNVFYNHSYITDDHVKEFERPLKDKNFPKSLIRLLRHREGDLPTEELRKIHTPTLLIWGEDDTVVPLEVGQRLSEDLPNAELITYKETGHLVSEERPNEISNHILNYHFSGITAE